MACEARVISKKRTDGRVLDPVRPPSSSPDNTASVAEWRRSIIHVDLAVVAKDKPNGSPVRDRFDDLLKTRVVSILFPEKLGQLYAVPLDLFPSFLESRIVRHVASE